MRARTLLSYQVTISISVTYNISKVGEMEGPLGQKHILPLLARCLPVCLPTMQLFTPLNRTQGLVSSAEALGVATETENKSTDKAKHSPVVDRAALYRFVRCCLL